MPDEQAAGHYSRAEDDHRRKDDLPGVHQLTWAACSWTAAASRVLSSSCERSFEVAGAVAKKVQALKRSVMATHGTAARQRAEAQAPHMSTTRWPLNRAMIRFSKAYGTLSLGGLERAAAMSFFCNPVIFIQPTYFQTRCRKAWLQILFFADFGQ